MPEPNEGETSLGLYDADLTIQLAFDAEGNQAATGSDAKHEIVAAGIGFLLLTDQRICGVLLAAECLGGATFGISRPLMSQGPAYDAGVTGSGGGGLLRVPENRATVAETFTACRLFASSFAPLFALLALRFQGDLLRSILGALAAVCFLDTVRLAVVVPRQAGASPFRVTAVTDRGDQVAGYLATYLLPFLAVPNPSATDLAAYGLFLLVAGVVSVRSGLTHINPTLYMLGYHVVRLTTAEGFTGDAIAHTQVAVGEVFKAVHLNSGVLVEVRT